VFLSVNFVREAGWTKRRKGGDGRLYGWEMRLSLSLSLSLIFGERKNNGADVDGKNEAGNEWAMCVGFWIFSYR